MYIISSSDDEDTADDRAITAVGLLNTLETMLGKFSTIFSYSNILPF